MILAAKLFDWKETLVMVRPQTFTRWHRQGFKLFWRWKSRPIGRPRIPEELRQLILAMARDNPTWGQERIAAELFVKLWIQVSPRTIRKYLPENPQNCRRHTIPTQRWMTFVRNHARTMLACDFFVSVTVRFQILYVFVMMEVGSRRLVHFNVTSHPTAAWTLQQFREVIDNQQAYRFVIHDRDKIYSQDLDLAVRAMGVRILKTPFRLPQANSHCGRLVGGLRRDCLGFLIPISERHLKGILKDWKTHYCRARPHASLGPGLPEPGDGLPAVPLQKTRHQIPAGYRVRAKPILGGLHHEYRLEKTAA
jgi:transposase InsO family protein